MLRWGLAPGWLPRFPLFSSGSIDIRCCGRRRALWFPASSVDAGRDRLSLSPLGSALRAGAAAPAEVVAAVLAAVRREAGRRVKLDDERHTHERGPDCSGR